MARIALDSDVTNFNKLLDPNGDLLEDVSQNKGTVVIASLNDPLFLYALLLPANHG